MNYKLKKDNFLTSKKYVWKDGRCLGHIFLEIKEKEDKGLVTSIKDRLISKYNAVSYPNESCGQHDNIKSAIIAIENKQHKMFADLNDCDIVTIGVDDI